MATFQGPFNTGNQQMDSGLNQFAGNLWGDPAKQAQAGLYGAQTGLAINQGRQIQDHMQMGRFITELMRGSQGGGTNLPAPQAPPLPGIPGREFPQQQSLVPGQAGAPPPSLANTVVPPPAQPRMQAPVPAQGAVPAPQPMPQPAPQVDPHQPIAQVNPRALQQPGGGVKYAPPAQSNGRPADPNINLPYLMSVAAAAGMDPTVIGGLARGWLNGQINAGIIDKATGERMLSGAGDSQPLQSTTSITTEGMRNRTTLALPGVTADAAIRQNDATLTSVTLAGTGPGTGKPAVTRQVPVSEVKAHPELYSPQDSARIIQAEGLTKIAPNGPNAPGVYSTNDQAVGKPVFDPETHRQRGTLADVFDPNANNGVGAVVHGTQGTAPGGMVKSEGDLILVVPNAGGTPASRSRAWLRANPDHREVTREEMQTVQSMGPKGPVNFPGVSTYGGVGGTVAAAGTDQHAARVMQQVTDMIASGDAEGARRVIEGAQTAQMTLVPKQNITPEQAAKIKEGSDAYFSNMYAPQSGTLGKAGASKLPAEADPDIATYHAALTAWLEDRAYKTNPAMAPIVAWDMMRADGIIPHDANEARNNVKWFAPTLGDPAITGDTEPRFRIKGDFSRVPRDTNGQIILPGGGVRPGSPAGLPQGPRTMPTGPAAAPPAPTAPPKPLVDTVAPQKTTAPTAPRGVRPPNAIGVAPPGAPEGSPVFLPDGSKGIVSSGYIIPPLQPMQVPPP
jgi:hypothetical protein